MVDSQKSESASIFLFNFEAFEGWGCVGVGVVGGGGVTSSKIAISEPVFSCFILFGVFKMLCKSEEGGTTYVGHGSCVLSKLRLLV